MSIPAFRSSQYPVWRLDTFVMPMRHRQWNEKVGRRPFVTVVFDEEERQPLLVKTSSHYPSVSEVLDWVEEAMRKVKATRVVLRSNLSVDYCSAQFREGLARLGVVHELGDPFAPMVGGARLEAWFQKMCDGALPWIEAYQP